MSEIRPCPCGSGSHFFDCCDPVIRGAAEAQTAEQLLRARYTAFATGAVDFIISSTHPEKRDGVNADETREWSEGSTWTGLDILKAGTEGEGVDYVCFEARYTQGGKNVRHREKSYFERMDGRWFFTKGNALKQPTVRREQPKVGRNEPCPCGSGSKFKKCCGN